MPNNKICAKNKRMPVSLNFIDVFLFGYLCKSIKWDSDHLRIIKYRIPRLDSEILTDLSSDLLVAESTVQNSIDLFPNESAFDKDSFDFPLSSIAHITYGLRLVKMPHTIYCFS